MARAFAILEGRVYIESVGISVDSRYEKYMQFVNSGSAVIPIAYIASVLDISYSDAMCDLSEMASLGYLGPGAYVNYKEQTVVLRNFSASGQQSPGSKGRKNTASSKTNPTRRRGVSYRHKLPAIPDMPAGLSVACLVVGIILLLSGFGTAADALDMIFWGYLEWYWISDAITGIMFALIGAGLIAYRSGRKKLIGRMKKYREALRTVDYMPINSLADYAIVSPNRVRKDITYMIKKNYLGSAAHFSSDKESIILTNALDIPKPQDKKSPEKETKVLDRYDTILKEIRQLDDDIADEAVSQRIRSIEDITGKIFNIVRERPEKEDDIKMFMSYYLPTTLKLLRSYSVFEKQGVQGENIDSTLTDIERILDTLVKGFSQQLDKMFQADAMDISADIDVLESMMQKDGLFGSSDFDVQPEAPDVPTASSMKTKP